MRQKRAKAYRKLMTLYSTSFGFREPYQVLIDSDFVKDCLHKSHDISARINDVLQGKVKIMITQCCMQRLYSKPKENAKAIEIAKSFERRKCNHWETKESDGECIKGLIGSDNNARYIVASQSFQLRSKLRKTPGVPLIYLSDRSVVILEPPSDATIKQREKNEKAKLEAPKQDRKFAKENADGENNENDNDPAQHSSTDSKPQAMVSNNRTKVLPRSAEKLIGKRKRVSNPNPLSVKKPKKRKAPPSSSSSKKASSESQNAQSTQDRPKKRHRRGKTSSKKKQEGGDSNTTTNKTTD